jgi:hypothetical protein
MLITRTLQDVKSIRDNSYQDQVPAFAQVRKQAGCRLEALGYSAAMFRIAFLVLCGAAVAGCKSSSWGPYVAPCVQGRVLDAETRQPLAGAKVSRTRPPEGGSPSLKGGELLMRKPDIQTDASGAFSMGSERVLTLFRFGGWDSVRLFVQRPGYVTLQTNYSGASLQVTSTLSDEPLAETGDILLQPARKKW